MFVNMMQVYWEAQNNSNVELLYVLVINFEL